MEWLVVNCFILCGMVPLEVMASFFFKNIMQTSLRGPQMQIAIVMRIVLF